MRFGWGLLAAIAVLVAASSVLPARPAMAATPMCPPTTFGDLGPPPAAETAAETPAPDTDTGPITEEPSAPSEPAICRPFVKRIIYPLLTHERPDSLFGAVREGGQRWHAGTDILVPQLTPVVAAADGVISTIVATQESMWVGIRHRDGWHTMYVHLNNDTYLTDDGLGVGIRGDLVVGSEIEAGTVIGWVGDSGNAEPGPPHLHFELRDPSFTPVDAFASLIAATRRTDSMPEFVGAFPDDDGRPEDVWFNQAVSMGVPVWCDAQGLYACPDQDATRWAVAEWARILTPDHYGSLMKAFQKSAERDLLSLSGNPELLVDCDTPLTCDQPVTGSELAEIFGTGVVTSGTCGKPVGDDVVSRSTLLRFLFDVAMPRTDPPCAMIT